MTDHDDRDGGEGDDDPRLGSLRAAWLAMPDEEPPQRGLAELMAAARVKAEELAKPSLWQRIVAMLRRPPVLALATVLVLVGGGVLIGQRGTQMEAEPELVGAAGPPAAAPAVTAEPGPAPEPAPGSAPEPEPEPGAGPEVAMPVAPAGDRVADPPSLTHRAPSVAKDEAAKAVPGTKSAAKEPATATTRAPAKAMTKPAAKSTTKPAAKSTKAAKPDADRGDDKPALQDRTFGMDAESPSFESEIVVGGRGAAPAPTETTSQAPSADATPRGNTSSSAGAPRASQYLTQAKTAAARGDCATAQAWMRRLASEDAAVYRRALASDAALKKCVVAQ